MQYDNTNRGALFKNDRKEKESHPDLKGIINIDGVEYWLSGWSKVTQKGDKMLSLSVSPKEQQNAPRRAQAKQAPSVVDTAGFDDLSDLPF